MDLNSGAFIQGSGAPAAPYPSQLIVPFTDSRGQQNWSNSPTVWAPLARSYLWRLEMITQRVRLDHRYSQAKSGDSIKQLLARLLGDVANDSGIKPSQVPPCVAWVLIGTNQGNAYVAATSGTIQAYVADMLNDLRQVLDWLVARGFLVLLCAEWPRGDTTSGTALLSADAQKVMYGYAAGIRAIRRRNVWVVDPQPLMADPAKTDYTPLPNMLNGDFLHNSNGAAEASCRVAEHPLNNLMGLPRLNLVPSSNGDQYDPVSRPDGPLNTNPMLRQGAGGTVSTNATGAAPEGYVLSAGAGLTVNGDWSDVTLPDGRTVNAFRMVISGTPTSANANAILRQSGLLSKVNAGDTLEALYEVYVAAGAQNFACPGLMIDTGASATRLHGGLSLTGDLAMPAQLVRPYYGVPRSAYGKFDTLPASVSFQFGPNFTLAGVASSLTIYLISAKISKVL